MNERSTPALPEAARAADPRALLASRKHTLIFLLICAAITVTSAMNAGHTSAAQAPPRASLGRRWIPKEATPLRR